MPIHDWSRVPSGLYHDFHQTWTVRIASILNKGLLPRPLSALLERSRPEHSKVSGAPPQQIYAGRANRVAIKHHLGKTIAIIEIISPGNKDTRASVQDIS